MRPQLRNPNRDWSVGAAYGVAAASIAVDVAVSCTRRGGRCGRRTVDVSVVVSVYVAVDMSVGAADGAAAARHSRSTWRSTPFGAGGGVAADTPIDVTRRGRSSSKAVPRRGPQLKQGRASTGAVAQEMP